MPFELHSLLPWIILLPGENAAFFPGGKNLVAVVVFAVAVVVVVVAVVVYLLLAMAVASLPGGKNLVTVTVVVVVLQAVMVYTLLTQVYRLLAMVLQAVVVYLLVAVAVCSLRHPLCLQRRKRALIRRLSQEALLAVIHYVC